MEANESCSGLTTSYSSTYPSQEPPPATESTTGTNGVPTLKSPSAEPEQKKRGRPRKYSTPEEAAAAAAKRATLLAAKRKTERERQQLFRSTGGGGESGGGDGGGSSNRSEDVSVKPSGQGFTPHVINVAAGEDVGQKILLLMQQTKQELCILSASGSIASAALRQPATSGGSIAYQGRFDIISLTGSYVRSDQGGKAGGLSVCLSSDNGIIVGGGVCGPLTALGPVEVVVATFLIEPKKDVSMGFKGETSAPIMPIPVSASPAMYRTPVDSSGGFTMSGRNDHQNMNGNALMMQSQWRAGLNNYDLSGNTGHDSHDSPEDGDYEHMPD